jgi:hypothetical protein
MDSDTDKYPKYIKPEDANNIFNLFFSEWSVATNLRRVSWHDFINEKDLGVKVFKSFPVSHLYELVDVNKWILTKIKYAI